MFNKQTAYHNRPYVSIRIVCAISLTLATIGVFVPNFILDLRLVECHTGLLVVNCGRANEAWWDLARHAIAGVLQDRSQGVLFASIAYMFFLIALVTYIVAVAWLIVGIATPKLDKVRNSLILFVVSISFSIASAFLIFPRAFEPIEPSTRGNLGLFIMVALLITLFGSYLTLGIRNNKNTWRRARF